MTELQAMEKGFKHTGLFSFDKSKMLFHTMLIRKKGDVCVLIPIPPSSDAGVGGWAIYWKESPENREARRKLYASKSTKCLLSKKRLLEVELEDLENSLKKLKGRKP